MTTRRDPMVVLERRMNTLYNNRDATDARIKAACMAAILAGADRETVVQLARDFGLGLPSTNEPDA